MPLKWHFQSIKWIYGSAVQLSEFDLPFVFLLFTFIAALYNVAMFLNIHVDDAESTTLGYFRFFQLSHL